MSEDKLNTTGKVPPSSPDYEETVLGEMLIDSDACKIACELLTDKVFYVRKFATIFKAIKDLHDKKTSVDLLTVTHELKRIYELDNIGGAYFISQLTNKVATGANIEIHCRIILQQFFKREIIRISGVSMNLAYDSFTDCFDLLDELKKQLKTVEGYIKTNKIKDSNSVIDEVMENITKAMMGSGITGFSTGITTLDEAIMGLRKKMKYLIAAQSGEGKSGLAKTIAVHLSHRLGIPGIVFSLEVTSDMFMVGCIAEILNIPNQRIQSGDVTDVECQSILNLKNTLFTRSLIIDDRGGLSPDEIKVTLRKYVESHNIGWFIVDYINLQKLKGKQWNKASKEERIAEIVNENKNMAKEFDLVCIELAQFTKEISKREGGKPMIGDLKDSAALEQSADVIMLIYRPEAHGITPDYRGVATEGLGEIIIAKNKYGAKKNLLVKFEPELLKFSDHKAGKEWVAGTDPF